ncbi:hypothetical protein [Lacrimispora sp.]|uniref:hypothetical protein n=1 Tax=Lacrimispora sp. TaxID=2719234 RepID=UPI0028A71A02|nr:hypothetical protein [Lacrimispora sp.]
MNSKNMKKALKAKLNDWLKSVDDANIKKEIEDNVIITGGAIVSLLTGDKVNDYDVYFRTKESLVKVAEYYIKKWNDGNHKRVAELRVNDAGQVKCFISSKGVAAEEDEKEDDLILFEEVEPEESEEDALETEKKDKYRPVFLTSNAITLSDKIQVVTRFYGEVDEIHKNYDFAHCTCAWSSWDNNLSLPQKALECIINKELYYIGSKYPLCSIIRTRKYINRGYTINAGQYLKMCLQLNELDLHNIETLKDQLVGVDSTYFTMALEKLESKKNEDPNFEPDNSYLFEVINRIF